MNEIGYELGYPKCCIEAFPHESVHETPFNGTGFLPCKECAKKGSKELLEEIVSNRTHSQPFPHAFGKHPLYLLKQEMLDVIYDVYEVEEAWRIQSIVRSLPNLSESSES